MIRIERFRPEHAAPFAALNRAWLEASELLEPIDIVQLDDPQRHFIDAGGEIFIALQGDAVVGTCAVMPHGADAVEIVKLAVAPEARGHGLGRQLVLHSIDYARSAGARRITLVSNSRLRTALRLYENLGFQYRPVPQTDYHTADTYMELELGAGDPAQSLRSDSSGATRDARRAGT